MRSASVTVGTTATSLIAAAETENMRILITDID